MDNKQPLYSFFNSLDLVELEILNIYNKKIWLIVLYSSLSFLLELLFYLNKNQIKNYNYV